MSAPQTHSNTRKRTATPSTKPLTTLRVKDKAKTVLIDPLGAPITNRNEEKLLYDEEDDDDAEPPSNPNSHRRKRPQPTKDHEEDQVHPEPQAVDAKEPEERSNSKVCRTDSPVAPIDEDVLHRDDEDEERIAEAESTTKPPTSHRSKRPKQIRYSEFDMDADPHALDTRESEEEEESQTTTTDVASADTRSSQEVKPVRSRTKQVGSSPLKDLSGPIPRKVVATPKFLREAPALLNKPYLPIETTTAANTPGTKSTKESQVKQRVGCSREEHAGKAGFLREHYTCNCNDGARSNHRFGPTFARHGHTSLPKAHCIDSFDNTVARDPFPSDLKSGRGGGGGKGRLAAIFEQDASPDEDESLDDTLILTQVLSHDRSRWLSIIALVDSGARDNNYISEELVRKLQLEREVAKVRTQVCPVGSACSIVDEKVLIEIKIKNELTNEPYIFSTYAYIYKGLSDQDEFDLIIGKPCMKKHRIVALLPYSFGLDDKAILSMAESIKARTVVNSSVIGSTERSSEQVVPHPNAGASSPVTTSRVSHSNAGTSVSSNVAKPHSNAGSVTARPASHSNAEAEGQNVPGTEGGTENKSLERRVKPIKLTTLSQRDGGQEISAATETHTHHPFSSITRGCSCHDDTWKSTTPTPIISRQQDSMLHELRVLPQNRCHRQQRLTPANQKENW